MTTNKIQIKRRAATGAPSTSQAVQGELAYNENDDILYIGSGGNATASSAVKPVGGTGAYAALTGNQTISGTKTFSTAIAAGSGGTGQNTYVIGDLLYASGTTALSKLAATTAGYLLTANGTGAAPSWTQLTSVALTTGTITGVPSTGNDIVNKTYADSIASGINFHQAAQLATTTSLFGAGYTYNNGTSGVGATLTYNSNAALTVDGVTPSVGNRILVKNETGAYSNNTTMSAAFNGVYTVTTVGSVSVPWVLTRATDYDTSGSGTNEIDQGDFILVINGSTLSNTSWIQQTALPITVGTTSITFVQFGAAGTTYTAGTGLTLSANQFSITNTAVTAASYGDSTGQRTTYYTVNAQGQLTAAASVDILVDGGTY